jgi:molecular chaperone DnaK
MVKEAEENAEADKARRALVEAKNAAESMIHGVEKSIEDAGDKVDQQIIDDAKKAIEDTRAALQGDDVDAVSKSTNDLANASMKIGEAIYKSQPVEPDATEPSAA